MGHVRLDHVHLSYEVAGNGPQLVLVHEAGGSLRSWDCVAAVLEPLCTVVRYDQRGSGNSCWNGSISLDDLADDLAAVLDHLSPDGPVCLVGAAFGAAQVARFASGQPERVRAVAMICPAVDFSPERLAFNARRAQDIAADGLTAHLDATINRSFPPALRHGSAYERYLEQFLGNDPHSLASHYRAMTDATQSLATLQCPVLLLAGTSDIVRPPDQVGGLRRVLRQAQFQEIPAGHFAHVQAPSAVSHALIDFFQLDDSKPSLEEENYDAQTH